MGNKRLKAFQIVIKGNEISEEYAEISRESFKPAIEEGIISEIVTYDAITPESEGYEAHRDLYNWETSLMLADQHGSNPDDHSPTEKAGMCSHWDLMKLAGNNESGEERFFVMEHDTYLLPDQVETLRDLVKYTKEKNPLYVNIGLFMGMYSLEQSSAKWMWELLVFGVRNKGKFPINCGPYCTLQRLFRTYTSSYLVDYNFLGIKNTVVHPWHECNTLYFGKQVEIPFNETDPDPQSSVRVPTTQVISKSLNVTQDHHGYPDQWINQPWTRHKMFHIVD